jgi:hypothetical protein
MKNLDITHLHNQIHHVKFNYSVSFIHMRNTDYPAVNYNFAMLDLMLTDTRIHADWLPKTLIITYTPRLLVFSHFEYRKECT